MKKIILTLALLFTISTVFTGCREEKSTGDKIEEAVEEVGDEVEDTADEVEDEIDDAI
jgi:predicted small secreted protein